MRVILIGATGTLGTAVAAALAERHEVLLVGNSQGELRVDLASESSIKTLYADAGTFDAVICAAGKAAFGKLTDLNEDDFRLGLLNKALGQMNLVRLGLDKVQDGGSFTLTSGQLCRSPTPESVAITPVNAAVEGFVRAAALDLDRNIRLNAVSPPWLRETLQQMDMDPTPGMPAARVAQAYVESVEGIRNGQIIDARDFG